MLHRLVYVSRPAPHLDAAALESAMASIRETSLRNNAAHGVSGALAYSPGWFVQALEGPEAAVDATFARIEANPLHGDIRVLGRTAAPARIFPDWAMALAPMEPPFDPTLAPQPLVLRFLIDAAQFCGAARSIPGFGLAPGGSRLRA